MTKVYPQLFVEKVNKSVMMNSNRMRHESEKKKKSAVQDLPQSVEGGTERTGQEG